jgi:NDP-sugar pyrophosphorylase family protein
VTELSDIDAVILAGGLGTRLRPVVSDRPKVLAEVHGRPFLAYLLDHLARAGVREVVLCTGYRGERIRAAFGEAYGSTRLRYSQEASPLGTGGALRQALPLLRSDTCLVVNGDSFCDAKLREVLVWHRRCNAQVSLVLTEVPAAGRFGRVLVDEQGRLVRFTEKGPQVGPGWINAGIYMLERSLLAGIPAGQAWSLERELFPNWIGRGIFGYRHRGRFIDIGVPEALRAAEAFFSGESPAVGV